MPITNRFFTCGYGMSRREQMNRDMVRKNCVPIIVTPDMLARAVDYDGIDGYKAQRLIEALINQAEQTAIAKTLGIEPKVAS